MDPITAFATAQAAIKGVQAAIKMGKDLNAISGDLMAFFIAKDIVAKAAATTKPGFAGSDTAQAFAVVMQAKQLQDAEDQLKQMLIWSGQAPVWESILRERNSLVAKRKAETLAQERARAKRQKEINEVITLGLIAVLAALVITLAAWGTLTFIDGDK